MWKRVCEFYTNVKVKVHKIVLIFEGKLLFRLQSNTWLYTWFSYMKKKAKVVLKFILCLITKLKRAGSVLFYNGIQMSSNNSAN